MGRKKKIVEPEDTVVASILESDAFKAVLGIFLSALSLFTLLSAFELGGVVGAATFSFFTYLLGIGYGLLPLSLGIFAVVCFTSFDGARLGILRSVSIFVFLFSALTLIEVAFTGKGGVVGALIAQPLLTGFDTVVTVIFLLAFVLASLIIAANIHLLSFLQSLVEFIRGTAEDFTTPALDTEKEPTVSGIDDIDDTEEPATPTPETSEPEEETPPAPRTKRQALEEEPTEDLPVFSASGEIYTPPPVTLLGKNKGKPEVGDVKANANIIKRTLQNFGIEVEMDEVSIGPTVTRYAMKPAEGVRLAKIVALQSNLELALAASPVRIEAPIPGKSLVGIEVPNVSRTTLGLSPVLSDTEFTQSDKALLIGLGRGITGQPHYADLAKMPHVLVAGTTGSGKSVMAHDMIVSLLYRCGPEQLRFVMVDPKRVELTMYNSIPHLLTPVITDAKKAILALKWLTKEMDRRYNVLETEKVRDIASYHKNVLTPALKERDPDSDEPAPEAMPYIVVIIDELADIMQTYPRELEAGIVRLAQMSRAVGIHLVLATQRPSVKVVTGLIKANIPSRIAFQVASQVDSKTILDGVGAENLLGAGDMLFLSGEMAKPLRIQAPYVSEAEVKAVVKWLADHYGHRLSDEMKFDESENAGGFAGSFGGGGDDDDELYADARAAVLEAGKASTSYLQRKLKVGYSRAARLMDLLEERGVIGPQDGAKPREVIRGPQGETADTLIAESDSQNNPSA